jgi:hypothetical protein
MNLSMENTSSEIIHASAILGIVAIQMVNASRWDGLNLSLSS